MKPIQTNHDYSRFAPAVTNEQALPAELFREMVTPQAEKMPGGPRRGMAIFTNGNNGFALIKQVLKAAFLLKELTP